MEPTPATMRIRNLGPATIASPLGLSDVEGDGIADYVSDASRIMLRVEREEGEPVDPVLGFEKAGPRRNIFFSPEKIRAAIVTCGGLCPGINNVIRSVVLELHYKYGVKDVIGFRYGYQGLTPSSGLKPMELSIDAIREIHAQGGTILGTSRGNQDAKVMVNTLTRYGVDILFCIGGDGTLRGAHAIHQEIARRELPIAVVGIPKTIDNDVCFVDKTFGFDTAVEMAKVTIGAAHTEAVGAYNGIGLVKLMGRESGFIAAAATLASHDVNFCLIPEVRFDLDGENGLLRALDQRLKQRGHAVIVVAEGCASAFGGEGERDASGNVRYSSDELDVGPKLRERILGHFKKLKEPVTLKYIDPSYIIRSVPANASDSIFADSLARHAVHAAMAGKTDMLIGMWHTIFTHVPIELATAQRKRVDPESGLWLAVTENTGQPWLTSTGHARMSMVPPLARTL